jgi:ankyrin repeat protein
MIKYSKYLLQSIVLLWISFSHAGAYEDFFRAVDSDDARTVNALLARGFDPNAADPKGQNALFLALRAEAPKVTAALLAHPALKVDAVSPQGETPLMMAALRGNLEWTQRLIERGAAINREGWTPLHYAASSSEPKVVALLLDRGAAIDARAPNGNTALMTAARYGAEESVTLLLARGADARLMNANNLEAADMARAAGREALAARLQRAAR